MRNRCHAFIYRIRGILVVVSCIRIVNQSGAPYRSAFHKFGIKLSDWRMLPNMINLCRIHACLPLSRRVADKDAPGKYAADGSGMQPA